MALKKDTKITARLVVKPGGYLCNPLLHLIDVTASIAHRTLDFHSDLDGFSFFHVVDGLGDLVEAVVVLRDEDGRMHAALLHDLHHVFEVLASALAQGEL